MLKNRIMVSTPPARSSGSNSTDSCGIVPTPSRPFPSFERDMFERTEYPAGFFAWLDTEEGYRVWKMFEHKALQAARLRPYYSAMAIAQVIRWETLLQDGTEFKLNNNWVPGLARLWLLNHGLEFPKFFQLRDGLGRNSTGGVR